jgi:hypothetical protein
MKLCLTAISFVLAQAAAIYFCVAPVYSGLRVSSEIGNPQPTRATLFEVNGAWAIVPVMFPVFVAVMPLLIRRQAPRIIAAIVLLAFSFVAGFTIGLFYLPSAIFMLLAACVEDSAKFRDALR